MRLSAEIDGQKLDLTVERAENRVAATVGGKSFDLEVSEPERGTYIIKNGPKIYSAQVSFDLKTGVSTVRVGDNEISVSLKDLKRLRSSAADDAHAAGTAEIKTAMPGKVIKILVETGAAVEKGDGVIIVEAMKMQNELKSAKTGVVKQIRVKEGATVAAGETLLTIE